MDDVLRNISPTLRKEDGGEFGFVCIWRMADVGSDEITARRGVTVGEFLSQPENQSGTWLIDGGWGGPPGPIHVRWNDEEQVWDNGGYCGWRFEDEEMAEARRNALNAGGREE